MQIADQVNVEEPLASPSAKAADRSTARVFYVGVGNIDRISSGLDRVTGIHLRELLRENFEVHAYIVNPEATDDGVRTHGNSKIMVLANGLAKCRGRLREFLYKLCSLLTPHALLNGTTLSRPTLRKLICDDAAQKTPDLVVVEHIYAVQHLPLHWLLGSDHRLVFVSHDVTPDLIGDLAREIPDRFRRAIHHFDRLKSALIERCLIQRATKLIFLSEHDRQRYPSALAKSVALLPLDVDAALPTAEVVCDDKRYVVFVGSPKFLPNRMALRWICESLAAALAHRDPGCQILLIGRGTESLRSDAGNVKGLGLVDDAHLASLLDGSLALISPIEHGSGIKIKILDALTAGVPVIATDHSFRGFNGFERAAVLDTCDPDACARSIAGLSGAIEDRKARRGMILASLLAKRQQLRGAFVQVLRDAVKPT